MAGFHPTGTCQSAFMFLPSGFWWKTASLGSYPRLLTAGLSRGSQRSTVVPEGHPIPPRPTPSLPPRHRSLHSSFLLTSQALPPSLNHSFTFAVTQSHSSASPFSGLHICAASRGQVGWKWRGSSLSLTDKGLELASQLSGFEDLPVLRSDAHTYKLWKVIALRMPSMQRLVGIK